MKKTYMTTLPDQAGAFLLASRLIGKHNGNIVRVNYNKAVDLHFSFIEVDAEEDDHMAIKQELREIGYLSDGTPHHQVLILELKLEDVPGTLEPVLELFSRHKANINYINSQTDGSGFQRFRVGLMVSSGLLMKALLDEVSRYCPTKIVEYKASEKVLDSTVFYLDFANEMRKLLKLDQKTTNRLIIYTNQIMQLLDQKGEMPLKTFEYVGNYVRFMISHRGEGFNPRISKAQMTPKVSALLIEPPCGSNVCVLDDGENLLFVDGGFGFYFAETVAVLRREIPDFDTRPKSMMLTHGDVDHAGLWPLMDTIYASQAVYENFALEQSGYRCYRARNPLHAPYCHLSKLILNYNSPNIDRVEVLGNSPKKDILSPIGTLVFADLHFEVLEGQGGHVLGETVYLDKKNNVLFTGDNLVNIRGFSPEQRTFNALAPYLMTSVNVDSESATKTRKLLEQWAVGKFVVPGHGAWMINN